MTLVHYSSTPIEALKTDQLYIERCLKPKGLWVSVIGEFDWKWWCESEGFRLSSLTFATQIFLSPDANILYLSTDYALDDFTDKYCLDRYSIDWPHIATDYDGIVIAPYQWSRRMTDNTFWYYGWDCASGCIWNMNAVSKIAPYTETNETSSDANVNKMNKIGANENS